MRTAGIIDSYNDVEWIQNSINSIYSHVDEVFVFDGWYPGHPSIKIGETIKSTDGTREAVNDLITSGYDRLRFVKATNYFDRDHKIKKISYRVPSNYKLYLRGNEIFIPKDFMSISRLIEIMGSNYGRLYLPMANLFGNMKTVIANAGVDLSIIGKGKEKALCLDVRKINMSYVSSRKKIMQFKSKSLAVDMFLNGSYKVTDKRLLAKHDMELGIDRQWMYNLDKKYIRGKYTVEANGYKVITMKNVSYKDIVHGSLIDAIDDMTRKEFTEICKHFDIVVKSKQDYKKNAKNRIYKKLVINQNIVKFVYLWLLRRKPDNSGDTAYTQSLNKGMNVYKFIKNIKGSDEYGRKHTS